MDKGETTLNSIYHSYTNIQTVMDILNCCRQGGDNYKFHISLIHKHSGSYGYIDVLWIRGDNSKFHISHTNIQTVMDILICCGQGGDNSKFHISHIHKHSQLLYGLY